MASKLEPFRQYNEHEVINLFRLGLDNGAGFGSALSSMKSGGADAVWDAGRLLCVDNGVQTQDPPSSSPVDLQAKDEGATYEDEMRSYLGMTADRSKTHVANISYPMAELSAKPGNGGTSPLGIALRGTLAYDENNEKLLYYTVKKDELQVVLPGQAVPILRRGILTFNVTLSVGDGVMADANGLIKKLEAGGTQIGEVIGKLGDKSLVALDV